MPGYAPDHAGLETIPFEDCLRLLASVPVGRMAFRADGEMVVLPVNHAVFGQDVVFRTTPGSKLSAAESQDLVSFEADDYDSAGRAGWSVVVTGHAEMVYEDGDIAVLDQIGLEPWPSAVERSFWVRIRPTGITGRRLPGATDRQSGAASRVPAGAAGGPAPIGSPVGDVRVLNVLSGEAVHVRATPFGDVGTVFADRDMEVVWVRKHGEPVDENWFSSHEPDVILVVQGQLKFEFEAPSERDRVLRAGDALVLPARMRCRAYSWPRNGREAAVFVAAYPVGPAA